MSQHCPACDGDAGTIIGTWDDWEAVCAARPDGPMRLTSARTSGVADARPGMWQCSACGSAVMTVLPTHEQLGLFYSDYHATEDFVRKAPKKVFRALKRLLPFRLLGGGGRFLEVGASIGTAAEAARKLGYVAVAQEIDPTALEQGRALYPDVEFVQGFLSDVPDSPAFDMIYAAEVIEHVPDPNRFSREIFSRLRPGGRLYVTTPDAGHKRRPDRFMEWEAVKPPEHITLFTQDGLRQMLARAGFKKIRFYPCKKTGIRMSAMRPKA
ncbi:MAG: class I SAM-dependent methyltransferase [Parvularcula sp.]